MLSSFAKDERNLSISSEAALPMRWRILPRRGRRRRKRWIFEMGIFLFGFREREREGVLGETTQRREFKRGGEERK